MSVNEDIADALIERRMRLLSFEGTASATVVAIYDRAIADLAAELERREQRAAQGYPISARETARLQARAAALDASLREARDAIQAELGADLNRVATVEAGQTAAALNATASGLGLSWVALPTPAALNTVGAEWSTSVDVGLAATRQEVRLQLASAFARGLGAEASVRELVRANAALAAQRFRLVTLVRTEFQRVANAAAMETYQANADVIGSVQYLATLDLRVCPLCGPLHNTVYPLTPTGPVGAPVVPRHPRCRCFYVPVTRSWEELGITGLSFAQRRGLTGEPSSARTFEGWLSAQSEAKQREVLDTDWRYEAWKSGAKVGAFQAGGRLLTREEYEAA